PAGREKSTTQASFIKWCNHIEDTKQKRAGRPEIVKAASKRRTGCIPDGCIPPRFGLSYIRTIVREEVHRLVNQTQESLDSDPQSSEETRSRRS
ncbi:hypothetical protein TNCV_329311, partial [Trichonephila clavipes]